MSALLQTQAIDKAPDSVRSPDDPNRSTPSLLNEIGLLASGYGLFDQASKIFDALAIIKPNSEVPFIGHAITAMNAGKWDDAIHILENKALIKVPQSETARCFLGLALKQQGRMHRLEKLLIPVAEKGKDASAVTMAKALLGRAD